LIDIKIKKRLKLSEGYKDLDINLYVKRGEIITIFGKSGEGKTTLLRIIAGLTNVDSGYIKVNQQYWFNSDLKINLPPQKREIGFVFQNYALFPNMTAEENILFGMEKEDKDFLEELIRLMELEKVRKLKPNKLSGGQKQRVALARALARKPKILLLDEPLSALDWEMRLKLQEEIKNIHKRFNTTIFLVSHNIDEVVKLSDRVFYLKNGRIEREGKPKEIFSYLKII
jgi:molybdate transport system ATP-binding protein